MKKTLLFIIILIVLSFPVFAACGDNNLDVGEACDDGNTQNNDGCSNRCLIEFCGDTIIQVVLGEECDPPAPGICTQMCKKITPDSPEMPECGNSIIETPELCDDGNIIDGDGCSKDCITEVCGDEIIQPKLGEQCDPPDQVDCDNLCQWVGEGPPPAVCGNSIIEEPEECDDSNLINNDGCNENCSLEICGDEIIQTLLGEQCDPPDENCSSECQFITKTQEKTELIQPIEVEEIEKCYDEWQCTSWSGCFESEQFRTCSLIDYPDCTLVEEKPFEKQYCEMPAVLPEIQQPKSSNLWLYIFVIIVLLIIIIAVIFYQIKKSNSNFAQAKEYVFVNRRKGLSDPQIRHLLKSVGWQKPDIDKLMKR